ncbi:hypothetical protein CYMTET_38429 [Cymbomonas tetramitiformis]|uniref:Uncharacterized protein n=1 Tax=Cymbomonas tetramitiformis TaxID=36881 RepID=A0AAE0CC26_9CHLO|nr:hypothetical protein CYMTET_38429 [Cymbomonas tetramitiformis]
MHLQLSPASSCGPSAFTGVSFRLQKRYPRTASSTSRATCRPQALFGWGDKKKDEKAVVKNKKKPEKKLTLRDIGAANKKAGWKSSSTGAAGFASKRKAYIEVKGEFLDEGYVDEDADVMGKLGKLFGRK